MTKNFLGESKFTFSHTALHCEVKIPFKNWSVACLTFPNSGCWFSGALFGSSSSRSMTSGTSNLGVKDDGFFLAVFFNKGVPVPFVFEMDVPLDWKLTGSLNKSSEFSDSISDGFDAKKDTQIHC